MKIPIRLNEFLSKRFSLGSTSLRLYVFLQITLFRVPTPQYDFTNLSEKFFPEYIYIGLLDIPQRDFTSSSIKEIDSLGYIIYFHFTSFSKPHLFGHTSIRLYEFIWETFPWIKLYTTFRYILCVILLKQNYNITLDENLLQKCP